MRRAVPPQRAVPQQRRQRRAAAQDQQRQQGGEVTGDHVVPGENADLGIGGPIRPGQAGAEGEHRAITGVSDGPLVTREAQVAALLASVRVSRRRWASAVSGS